MDKRNRLALGFLLAGLSAAGRALLSVPEGTSLAELSLTVLAVVGYLVLGRQGLKALLCGVGQVILELVLCGAQTEAGGAWVWLAPLLRDADLLLLTLAALYLLTVAGYEGRALPAVLAITWAVYAVTHFVPALSLFAAAQAGHPHRAVLIVDLGVGGQNLKLAHHVAELAQLAAAQLGGGVRVQHGNLVIGDFLDVL